MTSTTHHDRLRANNAAGPPDWTVLALCGIAIAYPFEGSCLLFRNLSLPDVLLCAWVALMLFDRRCGSGLTRIYWSAYGIAAFFGIGWIFLSALVSPNQWESGLAASQLAFVYLLFVPCTAFGLARAREPEKYVRRICFGFSVCYAIAFVLLMAGVPTGLVSDQGSQRFFPLWNEDAAYRLAVLHAALVLARLATGGGHPLAAAAELCPTAIVVAGIASRTSLVGVACAAAVSCCIAMQPRYLPRSGKLAAALGVILLGGLAMSFFRIGTETIANLPVRTSRLTQRLFDDAPRLGLIQHRVRDLRGAKEVFFGAGPGSEQHDVAVHSVFVQYAVDCGVPAACFMFLTWCAPMLICLRMGRWNERIVLAVVGYVSQLPFLAFMPVLTNASPYLPLAFLLGLVHREAISRDAVGRCQGASGREACRVSPRALGPARPASGFSWGSAGS